MNGAIIGYGTAAMGHMAGYAQLDDVAIRAVVDPCSGRRDYCRSVFPSINVYESIEDLFARQESLDFIDICAPPHAHRQYIFAGLAHRCHVLCEKPFLLASAEYEELQSLITSSGSVVYPCHNYKFSPVMLVIRRLIADGKLGDILRGHFRTLRSGHAVGVREWRPDWRRYAQYSGGGILRDHGTHSVYLACGIAGRQLVGVSCITGNMNQRQHQETDTDKTTEDTALLTLQFEGDVEFVIDLSWAAARRYTGYTLIGARRSIVVENDLVCSTAAGGSIERLTIKSDFDDPSHRSWFVRMFSDFRELVTDRSRQELLLNEAFLTSLVIDAAYRSATAGGSLVPLSVPFATSCSPTAAQCARDAAHLDTFPRRSTIASLPNGLTTESDSALLLNDSGMTEDPA